MPAQSGSLLAARRGKLLLLLLCAVQFLDVADSSIMNVALPSIRRDLGFSVQGLQWVLSGYLVTYGGLLLLGGRAGDLLGRRPLLVWGTALFAACSLAGGLAVNAGMLVGARLGQGAGAAMMAPAGLSILTTSFNSGDDRNRALGVWGAISGLAAAAGVFLGGVLSQGPGWRWVLFVNLPVCVLILYGAYRLVPGGRPAARSAGFDVPGAVLATGGMLLLVYALVRAPDQGWGSARTVGELATAAILLAAFTATELRRRGPLFPFSIFRIRGLAAADATQMIAFAAFVSVFYFLTLYMQNVVGFSPIRSGSAYLPVTASIVAAAGDLLPAVRPYRHPPGDRRRRADRRRRRLVPVPYPGPRHLPSKPAPRAGDHGGRDRRRPGLRHHRRQRRRPRGQGRARRRPAERLPADGYRARAGDLLRHRHRAHQHVARRARPARRRTHRRLPPCPADLHLLPARRSRHRAARHQHPR